MTQVVFKEDDFSVTKDTSPKGLVAFVINNSNGVIKTKSGANLFLALLTGLCFWLSWVLLGKAETEVPVLVDPSLIQAVQPTKPL